MDGQKYRWMDGWMDRSTDGWIVWMDDRSMDGWMKYRWMDRSTDGWIEVQNEGQMDGQKYRMKDRWMDLVKWIGGLMNNWMDDGWMDVQVEDGQMNKYVDRWTVLCMYSMDDGWIDMWLSKQMDEQLGE